VGPILHFAANFWWLVFPLGGAIGGGVRTIAAANERRAERRLERYRLKLQTKVAIAEASGRRSDNKDSDRRAVAKLLAEHGRTDERWLEYEVEVAKLLDFPLMTDMRNPLTVGFHKAKRRAELLRPERAEDLLDDRAAQLDYRDAVHEYVSAFEIAESEAIRRRHRGVIFSRDSVATAPEAGSRGDDEGRRDDREADRRRNLRDANVLAAVDEWQFILA
jgi:hypothetical protein